MPVQPVPADVGPLGQRRDLLRVRSVLSRRKVCLKTVPIPFASAHRRRRAPVLGGRASAHSPRSSRRRGRARGRTTEASTSHDRDDEPDRDERSRASGRTRSGSTIDRAGREHPEQPERDQDLPAEVHEPVVAHPRQRPAHQDHQVDHGGDLEHEPQRPAEPRRRAVARPRAAPAAEEQRHGDRRHGDGVHVLAEHRRTRTGSPSTPCGTPRRARSRPRPGRTGGRFVSASAQMKKITNAGNCGSTYQTVSCAPRSPTSSGGR